MFRVTLALVVLLAGQAHAAGGEDRVDPARGEAFARAWCSACHVVGRGQPAKAFNTAPSFQSLADNPELTEIALHVFLRTSHPAMPNVIVRPDEADDIVAYILSLRHK